MKKKIIYISLFLFIAIQFFRIDKVNPIADAKQDFLVALNTDSAVANILQRSCYDCHSNYTIYPWYTNIAPISWWIKDHIKEARRELNFSLWATLTDKRKLKKIKECIEQIDKDEMPLSSYLWIHKEASLSESDKKALLDYFKSINITKQ